MKILCPGCFEDMKDLGFNYQECKICKIMSTNDFSANHRWFFFNSTEFLIGSYTQLQIDADPNYLNTLYSEMQSKIKKLNNLKAFL